jgi:D-tagatose-1,6-bisphosphate aldolase subunit GatZ/KbaZ
MHKAVELVRDYVLAGFTKIHLDCSMRLGDDPPGGPEPAQVAERAAELAAAAEAVSQENLRFVIGSEVPLPGCDPEAEPAASPPLTQSATHWSCTVRLSPTRLAVRLGARLPSSSSLSGIRDDLS